MGTAQPGAQVVVAVPALRGMADDVGDGKYKACKYQKYYFSAASTGNCLSASLQGSVILMSSLNALEHLHVQIG